LIISSSRKLIFLVLLWRAWVRRWELSFTRTEVSWMREGVLLTTTTRSIMRLVVSETFVRKEEEGGKGKRKRKRKRERKRKKES
jgi:hypothetical protein